MSDTVALARRLNQDCECIGTDVPALQDRLDVATSHPHLFSNVPVFIAGHHVRQMQAVIAAVERVTALPAFREEVLARAPVIARRAPPALGVFFGYDFHVGDDGPSLIEINTNAGGAFLNVEMLLAQQACCVPVAHYLRLAPSAGSIAASIVGMFLKEWQRARATAPLRSIAIVDDSPAGQYLYPELKLARALFEANDIHAFIADARDLSVVGKSLTHRGVGIDLVYNRTTDFYLADPGHAALTEAYEHDLAVVTPHPHAHALYSNKRNLVLFSDRTSLRAMGTLEADAEILVRGVPRALAVVGSEERWWDERKRWFFKPTDGFGSRGTYRGDKITRRVFGDVMRGNYIAQNIVPPSERRRADPEGHATFKLDVRSYAYAGELQLLAARLYQGQTTNFRSAGGGFAPVYVLER
jgi:hypothetical protein